MPVTVPAGANPFDAFLAAANSCLTAAWDKVLYNLCFKDAFISPLTVDTGNKVSYVFASPSLQIDELEEVRALNVVCMTRATHMIGFFD